MTEKDLITIDKDLIIERIYDIFYKLCDIYSLLKVRDNEGNLKSFEDNFKNK